jgi:hypothetical protein
MPCRDYESDNGYEMREHYKEQCDKLARIACAAMEELERQGKEDFLILKNEEVGHWWAAHKEADRKEKARLSEIERKERVKAEALARLTDEEKELLGLKKPAAKKHKKFPVSKELEVYEEDIEYMLEDLKESYLQITRGK